MQDSFVQVDSAMLVEMRITKSSWIPTRGDVCRRSNHAHDDDCHQTCSSSYEVYPQVRCADEDVSTASTTISIIRIITLATLSVIRAAMVMMMSVLGPAALSRMSVLGASVHRIHRAGPR